MLADRIPACVFIAVVLASQLSYGETGGKYALLVGVETYDPAQFTRLAFAEDDVISLGVALEKHGFNVVTMTSKATIPALDPVSAADIIEQLKRRLGNREPSDTVIVALSGHGIQLASDKVDRHGKKETYFCPKRADVRDKTSLLPISQVIRMLSQSKAGRKLLIVDACRNEVSSKEFRDKSRNEIELELDPIGSARHALPKGLLAIFSCGEKEHSFESNELGHSVFTYQLLEYLNGKAEPALYPNNKLSVQQMASFATHKTQDYIEKHLAKDQRPQLFIPGGSTDWEFGEITPKPEAKAQPPSPHVPSQPVQPTSDESSTSSAWMGFLLLAVTFAGGVFYARRQAGKRSIGRSDRPRSENRDSQPERASSQKRSRRRKDERPRQHRTDDVIAPEQAFDLPQRRQAKRRVENSFGERGRTSSRPVPLQEVESDDRQRRSHESAGVARKKSQLRVPIGMCVGSLVVFIAVSLLDYGRYSTPIAIFSLFAIDGLLCWRSNYEKDQEDFSWLTAKVRALFFLIVRFCQKIKASPTFPQRAIVRTHNSLLIVWRKTHAFFRFKCRDSVAKIAESLTSWVLSHSS
jgi:hypothetical protein